MPTEKPIIFSTEMVWAILDGRKTQSRRVIKPQPGWVDKLVMFWKNRVGLIHTHKCPYGESGTVLWVRERIDNRPEHGNFYYHADNRGVGEAAFNALISRGWANKKSIPSIHLPRKAARLFLRVKNVRVERLQDISEEDALAEGISKSTNYYRGEPHKIKGTPKAYNTAKEAFVGIWDSLNLKRGFGWNNNPWVWRVEFEKLP